MAQSARDSRELALLEREPSHHFCQRPTLATLIATDTFVVIDFSIVLRNFSDMAISVVYRLLPAGPAVHVSITQHMSAAKIEGDGAIRPENRLTKRPPNRNRTAADTILVTAG